MARRHNARILLLDDVGQGNASEWVREKITALVDRRYRNVGGLVITTNLTKDEMAAHMGFRLASRLWDRQGGSVKLVHLTCGDYRDRRHRPDEE